MTTNVTGYGWRIERGSATGASLPAPGSDTFTQALDVEELTPPSATREVTERYVLDQTSSKKFAGAVSWLPAKAKLLWAELDTVHYSLEADSYAAWPSGRRNYRIRSLTDSRIYNFVGFVSKYEFEALTNQGVVSYNLEIAVDGQVTPS